MCVQYWTWRVTCRCIVHCWSCCEPSLSAHRWCRCCCHLTVMMIPQYRSAACWRRWSSALTRTPADSSTCYFYYYWVMQFLFHICFSVLQCDTPPPFIWTFFGECRLATSFSVFSSTCPHRISGTFLQARCLSCLSVNIVIRNLIALTPSCKNRLLAWPFFIYSRGGCIAAFTPFCLMLALHCASLN